VNRDRSVFGDDAEEFDPRRTTPDGVPGYGLSFGSGMHACIGQDLAAGLPAVGYRQWVLSFQGPLAVRLGYDTDLLAAVCEKLARALMQDLRRDVKRRHDLASVTPLHAGVMVS
jgi:hypothetical protein